jgi:hypothetical protein
LLDARGQVLTTGAAVQRRTAARAVAAVAGAAFARAHLDPVGVGLDAAAFGVDDRQRQRHVGRHLQLERAVGFDGCVAQDLLLLEVGLADGLAQPIEPWAAARRGWRARSAPARSGRPASAGSFMRARSATMLRVSVAVGGARQRDALGAAGAVGVGDHRFGHALQAVGVVDAAHLDQRHVLRRQRRVHGGRFDHVGLGPGLQATGSVYMKPAGGAATISQVCGPG